MSISATDDFLKRHRIESPGLSALAVFHAEPVSLIPREGYTFSALACGLINDLIADRKQTVNQFLKSIASDVTARHHSIIFFLDGPYHMAEHIWTIRSSIEEVANTLSQCRPRRHSPFKAKAPVTPREPWRGMVRVFGVSLKGRGASAAILDSYRHG